MKKRIASLSAIVFSLGTLTVNAFATSYIKGDVNNDGELTSIDATILLQKSLDPAGYTMNIESVTDKWLDIADMDSNGSVDKADSAIVLKNVLNSISDTVDISDEEEIQTNDVIYTTNITLSDGATTFTSEATYADGTVKPSDDGGVTIDNENNIITVNHLGEYTFSGTLTNGQIIVDYDAKAVSDAVKLTYNADGFNNTEINLSGANITCGFGPAIYGKNGDIEVSAVKKTENTLTDSLPTEYELDDDGVTLTDEPNGCIFSHDGIKLKGAGKLTINGVVNGVSGKDEVVIQKQELIINAADNCVKATDELTVKSGTLTLTSTEGDGLRCTKGDVTVTGGDISVNAANDGIHSKTGAIIINGGALDITSFCDGMQAETTVTVEDGAQVNVITNGTESLVTSDTISSKGIKSVEGTTINGGIITVNSVDDSIHSDGYITVNGGTLTLASKDDGIHSDTDLTISGGEITVTQSYEGIEGEKIYLNDGTVVIYADDDSVNAAGGNDSSSTDPRAQSSSTGYIEINGGYLYCENTKDGDGIDSNGAIVMNGGTVLVNGPTSNGNAPIDCGDNSYFAYNGGELVSVGSSGMAISPSSAYSKGYAVTYGINGGGQQGGPGQGGFGGFGGFGGPGQSSSGGTAISAGSTIALTDANGNIIAAFKVKKGAQCVTIGSSKLATGSTCTLYNGASISSELDQNGYSGEGTLTSGTKLASGTVNGYVTQLS